MENKEYYLRRHSVWVIKGLRRRELLLLACTVNRLLLIQTLVKGSWPGWPCCPANVQTCPLPFPPQTLCRPPSPLIPLLSVSFREIGALCIYEVLQPLVRLVPKIIDIALSSWQTRLSGHFFHFPALGESSAIPPFLLHFPRELPTNPLKVKNQDRVLRKCADFLDGRPIASYAFVSTMLQHASSVMGAPC